MAGLRELKSRLASIQTVGQLSGAMRTVSAAKYARVSSVRERFLGYGGACDALLTEFGSVLSQAIPQGNPAAPHCYVVIAGNRGLCGGYNVELLNHAVQCLRQEPHEFRLITVGQRAKTTLEEAGFHIYRDYSIPDVPEFSDCETLFDDLRQGYMSGAFSGVTMIYQQFVNMLTQRPGEKQILPMTIAGHSHETETLFLPDRETLLQKVALSCLDAALFSVILEAAAGVQAATLVAMRSAYDNAQESMLALETQISRRRQSDITASVIETSAEAIE